MDELAWGETSPSAVLSDEASAIMPSTGLSLNDPATFVDHARANGFSPAQAFALYHQRRLFSSSRWLNPSVWPHHEPELVAFVEGVVRLLDGIRTPAEWLHYKDALWDLRTNRLSVSLLTHTLNCFLHAQHVDLDVGEQENLSPQSFRTLEHLSNFSMEGWSEQAPITLRKQRGRKSIESEPYSWDNLRRTLEQDRLRWAETRLCPSRWTVRHTHKWMNRLCVHEGFAQVMAPWVEKDDAESGWRLVMGLRQFRKQVKHALGSDWGPRVLGLRGRLSVGFGMIYAFMGVHTPANQELASEHWLPGIISINSSCADVDVSLVHEWAHALDNHLFRALWMAHKKENPASTNVSWGHLSSPTNPLDDRMKDFPAVMRAFRSSRGRSDWEVVRRQFASILKSMLQKYPFENPAHLQITLDTLLDLTVHASEWPGAVRILESHQGWTDQMTALSVLALVWQYHHAPEPGQSMWDHADQSWAKSQELLLAHIGQIEKAQLKFDEKADCVGWFTDPLEIWARAFDAAATPLEKMDRERLSLGPKAAQEDLLALVQARLRDLKPIWDAGTF